MAMSAMSIVTNSIASALSFFVELLDATGLMPVYESMFALLVVVSFLVSPILGAVGSSDMSVRNTYKSYRSSNRSRKQSHLNSGNGKPSKTGGTNR